MGSVVVTPLKLNLDLKDAMLSDGVSQVKVMVITPLSPPYGGVATQSELVFRSAAFMKLFDVSLIQSNTACAFEDPSRRKAVSLLSLFTLLNRCLSRMRCDGFDLILLCTNGDISFFRDIMVSVVAVLLFRKPLAVHLHASKLGFWSFVSVESLLDSRVSHAKQIMSSIGYWFARTLLTRADSFSHLSPDIDKYYRQHGFKPADYIIPNATIAIDVDFTKKSPGSILFVGRLSNEKGFHDLLCALADVTSSYWDLNVLGTAPNRKDEQAITEAVSCHPFKERIHFRGVVTGNAKWEYYRTASIVVLPSYLEVFPNVLLEAITSGNAVIASDVGEVNAIMESNGAILVKPGNVQELSNALEYLLSNPHVVVEMGRTNYLHSSRFHVEHIVSLFTESIRTALDRFNVRRKRSGSTSNQT